MRKVALIFGAVVFVLVLIRIWPSRDSERSSPRSRAARDRQEAASESVTPLPGDRLALPIPQPETKVATPGQRERLAPRPPDSANAADSQVSAKSPPNLTPETRMHFVRSILQDYRSAYGQNPVGSNAEITAALTGRNARRSQFLRSDDRNLNKRGELIDYWGSPYFLHQISGKIMEIRSAGPDKTMWTADDLMVK